MVTEIAEIDIKPGMEQEFQEAAAKALPLFARAEGCHGAEVQRAVETPERFLLMIRWETVAHHTEKFVGTEDWNAWRALVGHCFAGRPKVYHVEKVV